MPDTFKGDPERLRQVLVNLLSNAIKFTHEGDVLLSVGYEKNNLTFSVRDTGIGLTSKQIENLFIPFSQADTSHTRKYGGTGLGLTICQYLVRAMGGAISVSSTPGVGSDFKFNLRIEVVKEKNQQQAVHSSFSEKRVLVVVDNRTVRHALKNMLVHWGVSHIAEIDDASNTLAQLHQAAVKNTPFDFVIVDVEVRGVAVQELARAINQDDTLKEVKLILLHPMDFQSTYLEKCAAVSKPIRKSELFNALQKSLGSDKYPSQDKSINASLGKNYWFNDKYLLLVEDNEINQEVAKEILAEVGLYKIDICDNGVKAVELVQQKDYDLVLMDIQMPLMDGLEATRKIRALSNEIEKLKTLPIIAMTAHAIAGDAEKSLSAGMNDHATKPIDPAKLFETLARWMLSEEQPDGAKNNSNNALDSQFLPDLPGIDLVDGLERLRGNWAIYRRLLINFSKAQHNTAAEIQAHIEQGQWHEASILAHTLKGSGGNLGAKKLHIISAKLEQFCNGKKQDEATAQLLLLTPCLNEIIAGLQQLLQEKGEDITPKREISEEKWTRVLRDLLLLLDADLAQARECLNELQGKKVSDDIQNELSKIQDALNQFDTDTAKHIVTKLLEASRQETGK